MRTISDNDYWQYNNTEITVLKLHKTRIIVSDITDIIQKQNYY